MESAARNINTLVRFCARRDVTELTPETLGGPADVAILLGGSILAGGDVFAAAMRAGAARRYMIVGGQGHSTDALRGALQERVGWGGVREMSEAGLFDRYLREVHGLAADLIEQASTNCGNNVTNALALLRTERVPHERIILVQDATMQRRMDAGFRRHAAPGTRIVNFAAHQTFVDDALAYRDPPIGMWPFSRYVSMVLGEIPRLTDDANGYGPAGHNFIAHVDIPPEVRTAFTPLTADFPTRPADARWSG